MNPEYPPGTGWVLSFFPKNDPITVLNERAMPLLAAMGIAAVFFLARKGLGFSCLSMAAAISAFLAIYSRNDDVNISIFSLVVPMTACAFLLWTSTLLQRPSATILLSFTSGILFGLVIKIRIASLLFLPGMMLIFLPRRIRLLPWFLAGLLINGILPLLLT